MSDSCVLSFKSQSGTKKEKIMLADILDPKSVFPENLSVLHPDSIRVLESLHPLNDSTFEGRLGFTINSSSSLTDIKKYYSASGTIEFFAVKREKRFGGEGLRVWSVLLGENKF